MLQKLEQTLLFLALLLTPTQLGKHFWPEFSYVYSLPIDYLSPTIYFWDLSVALLLLVWVLQLPRVYAPSLNLLFVFVLVQLISLLPGLNHHPVSLGAGLIRIEQYLITGLFGVYLSSADFKPLLNKIYPPLFISLVGQSMLSILQVIKGGSIGLWILGERDFSLSTAGIAKFDFQGTQLLRPYATFPHPNVLAAFMVIVGTLLAMIKPSLAVVSLIISGISSFLTFSRPSLIAYAISTFFSIKWKWLLILLVIILVLSPILYVRFASILNADVLALTRREQLIDIGLTVFQKSPIIGVGVNNFIPYASNELLIGPSRFLQPIHNLYILTLAETGLVGLLGFLILIGYPIWKLFQLKKDSYANTLLLIWLIILFLGLFDHYFLTLPQGYRLLFLVWGLSLSLVKTQEG